MKNLAVLTSGGDSPGMNACIRAVVRKAVSMDINVIGSIRGYEGLIEDDFIELGPHSVGNIIQRGGTMLKSARSKRFYSNEGRAMAAENLRKRKVDGLIVIGGDGSFTGASLLAEEHNIAVIGIPGTIDNDLFGTDSTIGYDTAINTVMEAVDKIRDTADSHDRLFIIEVMGKDAGFIALRSGLAVGAEAVLVPETPTYIDKLIQSLEDGWRGNKKSHIVMVAEGDDAGGALKVQEKIVKHFPTLEVRVSILGHMQRGGSPSAYDRVLASRLGAGAVEYIASGRTKEMVGISAGKIVSVPLEQAIKHHKELKPELLNLIETLSK